jgi:hypothetical protein
MCEIFDLPTLGLKIVKADKDLFLCRPNNKIYTQYQLTGLTLNHLIGSLIYYTLVFFAPKRIQILPPVIKITLLGIEEIKGRINFVWDRELDLD